MIKRNSSYFPGAVALVAAAILIAGGTAIASNTGFKANVPIVLNPAGAETLVGDNWLSIPYHNPYITIGGFCTQVGLASTGGATVAKATVASLDPVTGVITTVTCGSATASPSPALCAPGAPLPLPAGCLVAPRGYLVRQPAAAGGPASLIIVGSHNPNQDIRVFNGTVSAGVCTPVQPAQKGDNWVSIPYHTTAVTFADLCNSAGLSSTGGATVAKARVLVLDPVTGVNSFANCGSATAPTLNLFLGRAVQIREPNTGDGFCPTPVKTFVPAHF